MSTRAASGTDARSRPRVARAVYTNLSLFSDELSEKMQSLLTSTAKAMGVPPEAVKVMMNMDDNNWERVMNFQNEMARRMGV